MQQIGEEKCPALLKVTGCYETSKIVIKASAVDSNPANYLEVLNL